MTPPPGVLGHWKEFSTVQWSSENDPRDTCLKAFTSRSRACSASQDMALRAHQWDRGPFMCILWTQPLVAHQGRCKAAAHDRVIPAVLSAGGSPRPPAGRPSVCILVRRNPSKGIWSLLYVSSRESQMWLCQQVGDQRTTTPIPAEPLQRTEATLSTSLPLWGFYRWSPHVRPSTMALSECERHLDHFPSFQIKVCFWKLEYIWNVYISYINSFNPWRNNAV